MTSRLILARHGNTFNPEDIPVWVGARTDMPLVAKGLAQARFLADSLAQAEITPDIILVGPLQRTRQTAAAVVERLNLAPQTVRIDPRLTEIDYGAWEAQSTDSIIAAGGGAEMDAWNHHAIFPTQAGWSPSEAQILADTDALLAEITQDTPLIVTSNGILRFFARAAKNVADFPDRKVSTGHICVMERDAQGNWHITHWNQSPSILYSRGL